MKIFRTLFFYKRIFVFIFTGCVLFPNFTQSQITVNSSITPTNLVQNVLLGGGVSVSNVTYTGCPTCRGTFQGTSNIGMTNGILLTTGHLSIAIGPNNNDAAGDDVGQPGDADLQAIVGNSTYDASVLEFDFIPSSDTIKFNYVFASEEYPEFVCSEYNDVFAFFLTGQNPSGGNYTNTNIALIPGTTISVAINSVNNGQVGSWGTSGGCTSLSYSNYYIDNTGGATIQYDGFTKVLTAIAPVVKCTSYHIKIAIADVGDGVLDSGVFLDAHSFTSPGVNVTAISSTGDSTMAEGCGAATYFFTRSGVIDDTLSICYQIGGTATNGIDYTDLSGSPIGSCVTFLPGQDTVILSINPKWDGVFEPTETITLTIPQLLGCDTVPISATIYILNVDSLQISVTNDSVICNGESKTFTVTPLDGIAPYTYNWDNGASVNNTYTVSPPVGVYNYTIEVTDSCGNFASKEVALTVNPIPTSLFTLPDLICDLQDAQISYTGDAPSNSTYLWNFGGGSVLSGTGQGPYMINWQQPGISNVSLAVTSLSCTSTTTTDSIEIVICPLIIPNVFTPNGDVANQYFVIKNIEYYNNPHLLIYNRWGNKVFESNNYQNEWNGSDCSDGTYYYVLILEDGTSYHGIITILR